MNVGLLNSVSAIALVGYVGAVIYHGNLMQLVAQLGSDWRFLEVLAAIGVLYALAKVPVLTGPVMLLVGVAVVGVLLKLAQNSTILTAFQAFGTGQLSLSSLADAFGAQAGKSLGFQSAASMPLPTTGVVR